MTKIQIANRMKYELPKKKGYDAVVINDELTVIVPEGVTKLPCGIFGDNAEHVEKVVLPSSLTEIVSGAFYNCVNLKEIEIPAGVTYLWPETFCGCKKLKKVVLNEGLIGISYAVFADTPALEELNIPATVTQLGGEPTDGPSEGYYSPFESVYGLQGSGIAKENIRIACPQNFTVQCFYGTKKSGN